MALPEHGSVPHSAARRFANYRCQCQDAPAPGLAGQACLTNLLIRVSIPEVPINQESFHL